MVNPQIQVELRNTEDRLRGKYSMLSMLFLIITIVLISCIAIVFIGISIGYGYNWALFGLDGWIIVLCSLFGIFIFLELVFYYHFSSLQNKREELEKPKPEFINEKRVYIYSHPEGREGGVLLEDLYGKNFIEKRHPVLPGAVFLR